MSSHETQRAVREHLHLSRGLLETAVLNTSSSEFEERNALSRAYYALFHAVTAMLISKLVVPSKSHGRLHDQVQRRLGREFGRFLRDLYELRQSADYKASWTPIRYVSDAKLKKAWTNVLWLCGEVERSLN
jgi:uncharacterized protein (UPF0332 family)